MKKHFILEETPDLCRIKINLDLARKLYVAVKRVSVKRIQLFFSFSFTILRGSVLSGPKKLEFDPVP